MATLADSFLDDLDELGESSDDEQQEDGTAGDQPAGAGGGGGDGDGDDDIGVSSCVLCPKIPSIDVILVSGCRFSDTDCILSLVPNESGHRQSSQVLVHSPGV